uniref:G_PROTEIN_RECEP_F1_2 domain-containing protein n=1 Tax=Panagrellus redivivus TaxID=6233 RepID=A0A7E4VZG7_PANRE
MKSYRRLVVAYMPFSILATTSITLTQPVFLNQAGRFYFMGILKGFEEYLLVAVFLIVLASDTAITDCLLAILINRYQIISSDNTKRSKLIFTIIYSFLFITGVISLLLVACIMFYERTPGVFGQILYALSRHYLPFIIFYQFTRISGFILIIFLNVRFGRQLQSKASHTVIKLHKMLIRAVVSQVICSCIFTRIPLFLVVVALFSYDSTFLNVTAAIAVRCLNTVFLGDMIVTIYNVNPYRRFVLHLLNRDNVVEPSSGVITTGPGSGRRITTVF